MRTVVLWAAALSMGAPALAQSPTGALAGRVLTRAGQPAADVSIAASGSAMPGVRPALTDARGYFHLLSLPVGTYRIRFARIGFRPVVVESVAVRLDRTTSLGDITLPDQAIELGELVVTSERALLDPTSATVGSNLPATTFRTLPTAREFRSIVALAPQANLTGLPQDEVNVAGSTGPENVYYLDGMNITDPLAGASSTDLPYNFVREVQLKAGGYEAEHGRAMGGIINAITQTGSDRIAGQVFGFFTNRALTSEPRFGVVGATQPGFSEWDVGGSLGGPVVRRRLWFYVAYNPSVRNQVVSLPGVALPSDHRVAQLFAGKLTWQPNERTDAGLTVLGDPVKHRNFDNGLFADHVANIEAVLANSHQGGLLVSGTLVRRVGRSVDLELDLSRVTRDNSTEPGTALGATAPGFQDLTTNTLSGGFGGRTRMRTVRSGARGSATIQQGRHTFKAGGEYEDNFLDYDLDFRGEPGTPGGFIREADPVTFTWFRGRDQGKLHNRVPTFYLQDAWRVTRRLQVNLGVRWDGQYLSGPDGTTAQSITDQWQPRAGFILQLGAAGAQQVTGSFGRFYEQLPLTASTFYYHANSAVLTGYDHDPRTDTTGGTVLFNMFGTQVEPRRSLKGEHFDEFTLGYERAIGGAYRFGVRGMYRVLRWAIDDAFDADSGTYFFGNPGRGILSFAPRAHREYTALVVTLEKPGGRHLTFGASYVLSRNRGNYEGLYDFEQDLAFPNVGSQFDFPEQWPNGSGLLPNDRTHALKLYGSWFATRRLTLGGFFTVQSGTPRNEFGATSIGAPFYAFLRERGTNGRTPAVIDLNLRASCNLPGRAGAVPRVQVDVFHIGNFRHAVAMDDVRYTSLDVNGNQAGPNPSYGVGRFFQPPMSVRLGLLLDF